MSSKLKNILLMTQQLWKATSGGGPRNKEHQYSSEESEVGKRMGQMNEHFKFLILGDHFYLDHWFGLFQPFISREIPSTTMCHQPSFAICVATIQKRIRMPWPIWSQRVSQN